MKENAESIVKFIIRQEQKLLSIIDNIDSRDLSIIEKNLFRDLVRTAEKNINFIEKDYQVIVDRIGNFPMTNFGLDDFDIDVPKRKKINYQTSLIFIMKIADNFSKFFSVLLRKYNDELLHKMFEPLINEKDQLKQRTESIYDKIIA